MNQIWDKVSKVKCDSKIKSVCLILFKCLLNNFVNLYNGTTIYTTNMALCKHWLVNSERGTINSEQQIVSSEH